jgi:hypothetical protein
MHNYLTTNRSVCYTGTVSKAGLLYTLVTLLFIIALCGSKPLVLKGLHAFRLPSLANAIIVLLFLQFNTLTT